MQRQIEELRSQVQSRNLTNAQLQGEPEFEALGTANRTFTSTSFPAVDNPSTTFSGFEVPVVHQLPAQGHESFIEDAPGPDQYPQSDALFDFCGPGVPNNERYVTIQSYTNENDQAVQSVYGGMQGTGFENMPYFPQGLQGQYNPDNVVENTCVVTQGQNDEAHQAMQSLYGGSGGSGWEINQQPSLPPFQPEHTIQQGLDQEWHQAVQSREDSAIFGYNSQQEPTMFPVFLESAIQQEDFEGNNHAISAQDGGLNGSAYNGQEGSFLSPAPPEAWMSHRSGNHIEIFSPSGVAFTKSKTGFVVRIDLSNKE